MSTVWCLFDYRELDGIFTTKERAEFAWDEAVRGHEVHGYHIYEWEVDPTGDES